MFPIGTKNTEDPKPPMVPMISASNASSRNMKLILSNKASFNSEYRELDEFLVHFQQRFSDICDRYR